MNWYINVLKKYAEFDGRARRKEFWYFFLFQLIAVIVLAGLDSVFGLFSEDFAIGTLSGLYILATLLPSLAVSVRRLHDTSRSGYWYLITFIPLVGPIVFFIFAALDSTPGSNQYGDNPKGV